MSMLFNNICKYHPLPHSGTHTRLTVTFEPMVKAVANRIQKVVITEKTVSW